MILKGGIHTDDRGKIAFVNDFNFNSVKRFYTIHQSSTEIIRAWQGHKKEIKWFYVVKGSFRIAKVKINNWDEPQINSDIEKFTLFENKPEILMIPEGHANGFKALEPNSILIIYSNLSLKESELDLIRFPETYWKL